VEEKRKDLEASRQKELIYRIVSELNELYPSLYYAATSEIAYQIEEAISAGQGLNHAESQLLKGLSRNDIQMILSLHND